MHVSKEMSEQVRCNLLVFKIGVGEMFSVRFLTRHINFLHFSVLCEVPVEADKTSYN